MPLLIYGVVLFIAAFCVHFVFWRIRLPQDQTKTLMIIFLGVLILGLALALITGFIEKGNLTGYLYLCLFYLNLTVAYLLTYSAVYAQSPTLLIVAKVAKAKSGGLPKEELEKEFTDESLVKPRIKDLYNESFIHLDAGKYKLTMKGKLFIGIFIFYRRLLGAPLGG
jgi:Ca2+/Na+ antiporter